MKYILIFCLIFEVGQIKGQNPIIDQYINEGIRNNLSLKQHEFSLKQSIAELDKAKGMFFPSIDVKARYTRAGGGRNIDILVGDLVNPIHQALNAINPSFGFPGNIPNEKVPFLRKEEHDTKISLVQPLIQPALFYNYSINSSLLNIQKLEKNVFKRKLIADIKYSYLSFLKACSGVELFENTMQLLEENLRVNKSLYKNDKVTIDILHRANAELSEIEQKLLEAKNNKDLAKSYFNFLLNRPLDTNIDVDENELNIELVADQSEFENLALKNREELNQFKNILEIAEDNSGIVNSKYLPGLALAVDYGFQGEKYNFSKNDDYWMASLVLNWNLFNGFKDNAEAEKAELELRKNSLQIIELQNKIRLQVREAYQKTKVAQKIIKTADEQLQSSESAFRIVNRKYEEGMTSQIEFIDAQNQLLQSQISKLFAKYTYLESYAELEKVSAIVDLEKFN